MIRQREDNIFLNEFSALFGWAHEEAKAGNIKKAILLLEISEKLSKRNRKYRKHSNSKRRGLFYI